MCKIQIQDKSVIIKWIVILLVCLFFLSFGLLYVIKTVKTSEWYHLRQLEKAYNQEYAHINDADKIRDIISKFEDKEIVNNIKEEDNGINIYIGSENDFDNDFSNGGNIYTARENLAFADVPKTASIEHKSEKVILLNPASPSFNRSSAIS